MKKLLMLLLFCGTALAQSNLTTVTANLVSPGGAVPSSDTFVRFELKNYGTNVPRVLGTSTIVPSTQDFYPNSLGQLSTNIVSNAYINPNNTYYLVSYFSHGNRYYSCSTQIEGPSFDLDSATCTNALPPGPALPSGVYGPQLCSPNDYINGLTSSGSINCASPTPDIFNLFLYGVGPSNSAATNATNFATAATAAASICGTLLLPGSLSTTPLAPVTVPSCVNLEVDGPLSPTGSNPLAGSNMVYGVGLITPVLSTAFPIFTALNTSYIKVIGTTSSTTDSTGLYTLVSLIGVSHAEVAGNTTNNLRLMTSGSSATGHDVFGGVANGYWANVNSSNLSYDINVHDNYGIGPELPQPPALGGTCFASFFYTQGVIYTNNVSYGFVAGAMYWGGDAAQQPAEGGSQNVKWARDIIFTHNKEIHATTGTIGNGGLWGGMGDGIICSDNFLSGGTDIILDCGEGSSNVDMHDNDIRIFNTTAIGIACFYNTLNCIVHDNKVVSTVAADMFRYHNPTADPRNGVGLNVHGNSFDCSAVSGALCNVTIEASDYPKFTDNHGVNVAVGRLYGQYHGGNFSYNDLTFNTTSSALFMAFDLEGDICPPPSGGISYGAPTLYFSNNSVKTNISQPSGSAPLKVYHNDYNCGLLFKSVDNVLSGSSTWPAGPQVIEDSLNYTQTTFDWSRNALNNTNVNVAVPVGGNGSVNFRGGNNVCDSSQHPQDQLACQPLIPTKLTWTMFSLANWGTGAVVEVAYGDFNWFYIDVLSGTTPPGSSAIVFTFPYTLYYAPNGGVVMEGNSALGTPTTILPLSLTWTTTNLTISLSGVVASTHYHFAGTLVGD